MGREARSLEHLSTQHNEFSLSFTFFVIRVKFPGVEGEMRAALPVGE